MARGGGRRVLVVHRDFATCWEAYEALWRVGFVVDFATTAEVLYRLVQSESASYDALVVDGELPGLPVEPFARRLRVRHPEIALAVIAAAFDARHAPFDAGIEKRHEPGALIDIVGTATEARDRRLGRSPPD
jgi:DNA-binding NtrC family response regulator